MFLKWRRPNEDSVTTKSYLENSNDVETTFNHLVTIDVTLDNLHRWKEVDFSVSFNTSAGLSPWSNWVSISGASNGKCVCACVCVHACVCVRVHACVCTCDYFSTTHVKWNY